VIDYVLEPIRIAQRKPETRIDVASSKRCEATRHRNISCHLAAKWCVSGLDNVMRRRRESVPNSGHDDPAEKAHEGIRDHDGRRPCFHEGTTCTNDQASSDSTTFEVNVLARDCVC